MNIEDLKKNNCTCSTCISYCKYNPGWFLPEEIKLLSDYLNLSLVETFRKYLIIDFWIKDKGNIYTLAPIKDFSRKDSSQMDDESKREFDIVSRINIPGGKSSWGYPFWHAPCIFLENDRCKIYKVRPFECAIADHSGQKGIRFSIAKEWEKSNLIQKLGRS